MKLYEVEQAFEDCFNEDGEVINQELFDELSKEKDRIIEWCGLDVKNKRAIADAKRIEAKKLKEGADTADRAADRQEARLSLILNGQKFIAASGRVEITFKKSEAVKIINESEIPGKFWKATTENKPSLQAIKDAIKAGETVSGAELVKKENIQIK
jgi:hypothetical protein